MDGENGYHVNGTGNGTGNGRSSTQTLGPAIALGPRFALPPDALPPHNLEAEQSVLGSCLLDNGVIPKVTEVIGVSDFYREAHQVLMRAILVLHAQRAPVDAVTVADELTRMGVYDSLGGDEWLDEVTSSAPSAANAVYYARIVKEKADARALIEFHNESIRRAYSNNHTSSELLDLTVRSLHSIESRHHAEDEPEAGDPFARLRPWPEPIGDAVWYGLAGEIVGLIAPHTEADPIAILGQILVGFGNMVGRGPHWRVEATRQGLNMFLCVVGNSSKARKGTSWGYCTWLLSKCDEAWARDRIDSGLTSGEGLIWFVRDPIVKNRKSGDGMESVEIDPGVPDKRALFVESEFGGTLTLMARDGNSLSAIIRQAWDGQVLSASSKNSPAKSRDAHVSIIGHITCEDLHKKLSSTDAANGFANRFLWVCARRSQYLPHGGQFHTVNLTSVVNRLKDCLEFARFEIDASVPLLRDAAANQLWEEVYTALSSSKPGLLGSVTSRAEAQTMRLAALYAVLDCSKYVRRVHLEAALAFWRYCEQSAAYIFGDALGDPDAEKLLEAIVAAGDAGISQTQIRRTVFRGHKTHDQVATILGVLLRSGMVHKEEVKSGGRPTMIWRSSSTVPPAPKAPKAPKVQADYPSPDTDTPY